MPSPNRDRVRRCGGPGSRREFLRAGTLALGGLGAAQVARLRAETGLAKDTDLSKYIL